MPKPGAKGINTQSQSSGILTPSAGNFLTEKANGYNTDRSKAFVNRILFDEQFKYVASVSGAEQVGKRGI